MCNNNAVAGEYLSGLGMMIGDSERTSALVLICRRVLSGVKYVMRGVYYE
jgi:hypothetical protein